MLHILISQNDFHDFQYHLVFSTLTYVASQDSKVTYRLYDLNMVC